MKKNSAFLRFLIVIVIIVGIVLYFPTEKVKVTSAQKEELTNYVKQISVLNAQRTLILQTYQNKVLQAEKMPLGYRALEEEILPAFIAFQTQAESHHPNDPAIVHLHKTYLTANQTQLDSFTLYVKSYREQQDDTYKEANNLLEKSNDGYADFDKRLRKLAKTYNITLPEPVK